MKRGFMLVMVLVALLIVGAAFASVARQTLSMHRASIDAHLSLQQRWGLFSCQRSILPATDGILQSLAIRIEPTRGKRQAFPSYAEDRVVLGGQVFALIVADEDAKANLNSLFELGGARACVQTLGALLGPHDSKLTQLVPARGSDSEATAKRSQLGPGGLSGGNDDSESRAEPWRTAEQPAFRSWGEVFDLSRVRLLAGDDRYVANLTRRITLFGTGRLNVFRADDDTILATCKAKVSDGLAKRVLEKLRESSLLETNLILEQTVTNAKDRLALQQILSSSSRSFSLWVEASSPRSRIQRLAIMAPNEFGLVETQEFAFD
jgi:type II secretory pathway component PulK